MGFMDDAKDLADKAEDHAADHKDTLKDGVDKAGDFAKEKAGSFGEHVDTGVEAVKGQIDKLEKD